MKFSIRDLLLVSIIVALAGSWWIDRQTVVKERTALQTERKALADEKVRTMEEQKKYTSDGHKRLMDFINEQKRQAIEREAKKYPDGWLLQDWIEPLYFPPDPNAL